MKQLLVILSLFITSMAFGQSEEVALYPIKGDKAFGVMLSLNSSYIGVDGEFGIPEDQTQYYALSIAGYYETFVSKNWSFKGTLRIDPKGAKAESANFLDVELGYITTSVVANWHFGKKRRWYLHFGPYYGMLLNAKAGSEDIKELINSSDFGIDLAIGIKIPVGSSFIFIESGGQTGLSKLSAVDENDESRNVRNALSLGYIF